MDPIIPGASFVKHHAKAVIVFAITIIFLIFAFTRFNSLYTQGVEQEQRLDAQYLDNQNYLSAYISGFHEQVAIATSATTSLDQVLTDAVKGRYEQGGYAVNSPFFNVIREAYPEASTQELTALWGRINTYIASQREGYRNTQSKFLDMLRSYDTWRNSGIIQSIMIRIVGYPSDRLIARIGDNNTIRGQAALDRMYQIVLTTDALNAYNNGTLDPLKP